MARQNLHAALRPGGAVRVRGAVWRVRAVKTGADCLAVDLEECGPRPRRRTLLHPFDRMTALDPVARSCWVSRRGWMAVLRHLLEEARDFTLPLTAAAARIDVLPYQLQPLLALLTGGASRLLIADAVGLGKTIQAGLILAELQSRSLAHRCLVVAPAGLRQQWVGELEQRFALAPTLADADWLARRAQALPATVNPWTLPGCYVTSIDFVKQPEVIAAARDRHWDVLVVDEAHLAAAGTDRGAAIHDLASRAQWVVLLTATPHDGDEERFAALCRTGRLGGIDDRLLVFRRSAEASEVGGLAANTRVLSVRPSPAEAHAHALLARYAARVWTSADTCTHDGGARLAMTVLLKRAYSSMRALERSVRRRLQLLQTGPSGPLQPLLPLDPGRAGPASPSDEEPDGVLGVRGLENPARERAWLGAIAEAARTASHDERKIAAVRRLLARTTDSLLLFTEFRDTAAWIARAIGPTITLDALHGGLSERERHDAVARFCSGRSRVLIATDAAALGLNLQHRCRLVVNLEVPWNPNRIAQRVGRLARIGQRRRVHATLLVGRGTGEQRVLDLFRARQRNILASLRAVPVESPADDLAVATAVLEQPPPATRAHAVGPTADPQAPGGMVVPLRQAGSTLAFEARRCADLILARRRQSPQPLSARLGRRRPFVARLRTRGGTGLSSHTTTGGLALIRASLVDAHGHPWATTLVPLAFRRGHTTSAPVAAAWLALIDRWREALESEARRQLGRWAVEAKAPIEGFVKQAASRAGALEARLLAERRRPYQLGLFGLAGGPAAIDAATDTTMLPLWLTGVEAMTLECDLVLAARVLARACSTAALSRDQHRADTSVGAKAP